MFNQITILGVGLLGGSFGMAAKKQRLAKSVVGVGRNEARLQHAVELGAIDRFTLNLDEGCRESDFVLIATHLDSSLDFIKNIAAVVPQNTLVTDVGSVKREIVEEAEKDFKDRGHFIGSHPMAGSDKTGVQNARANLFDGAVCFVTVTPRTNHIYLSKLVDVWKSIGSEVIICRPERHDYLVARASHLPHFAAVAIAAALKDTGEDMNLLKHIIGTGFLDTTRIAKGSSDMWTDICRMNKDNIVKSLNILVALIDDMKKKIEENDFEGLQTLLSDISEFRQDLDT